MWSTILPELMSITVFILTTLCLRAGNTPSFMQDYNILSVNTTDLKDAFHNTTTAGLPIHDVYNLYMMTACSGYNANNSVPPLAGVTCSPASWYYKFFPATLIQSDLAAHGATTNLSSLHFPPAIHDAFNEGFNLQLHVAFVFYVFALIWVGCVVLWGLLALFKGNLGKFGTLFTTSATTCLLISSTIVSVVQAQAVALINDQGAAIGLQAGYNTKFLALTWSAFAINVASTLAWLCAGLASAAWRSHDF